MILRKAIPAEAPVIWTILQHAIEQRRLDGSDQWQDGYPNKQTVQDDLKRGCAYVLEIDNSIAAYAAIIFDDDPAYNDIKGAWHGRRLCKHPSCGYGTRAKKERSSQQIV